MTVYEDSMEKTDCETEVEEWLFSALEKINVSNRNIAYLLKEKKVFSYIEEGFDEEKVSISLKKMRTLINYGFDALSSYILEKEGYDSLAIDLRNEQVPYDRIVDMLIFQDSDMNTGQPVMDENNMRVYDDLRMQRESAVSSLITLNIIPVEKNALYSKSWFYNVLIGEEITPGNINSMILEDIGSEIDAKYEDPEERKMTARHIASYIKSGIEPVNAARGVIDTESEEMDAKYSLYKGFIDGTDSGGRYSRTEAFEKVFGRMNLARKIMEQTIQI
ncbi:MAG: hypothetical protein U9O53_00750 [archaeon]|nr:hypothetical protein [archaeon]